MANKRHRPTQQQERPADIARPSDAHPLQQQGNKPNQPAPPVSFTLTEEYTGIIPPQLFERYGDTELGRAYISGIIEQGVHRRHLEKVAVEGDNKRANNGQWISLGIALFFCVCGTAVALFGTTPYHAGAGATIATAAVVGLVTVFLKGASIRTAERERRLDKLTGQQREKSEPEVKEQTPKLPGIE